MGRKFRLRSNCGFKYIRNDRVVPDVIVDETDKDFAGQRHKFEEEPVDEAVARKIETEAAKATVVDELAGIEKLARPALVELYAKVVGKPPPDGAKSPALRQALVLVREGTDPAVAAEEVFGVETPPAVAASASAQKE